MSAFQRHAQPGGKLQSVLELGCGPANHSIQLAKRGVKAWALDNNANMLAHAAKKAAAAGASSLQTVQGDMTQFSIKVGLGGREGGRAAVVALALKCAHGFLQRLQRLSTGHLPAPPSPAITWLLA